MLLKHVKPFLEWKSPGSFSFILMASITCHGTFESSMIPLRAGLTSCLVAFVYCLLTLRRTRPVGGNREISPG